MRILKSGILLGTVAVVGLYPATSAYAQEEISGEQENAPSADDNAIYVTARKRAERLIDVPETITAFTEETLIKSGITNIDRLGQALPNVTLSRRGDNEPNVVIRGVGSFGNVQGIGFYVDDVQNFTDQASRLVDLERVEVLKGPQGTLYGGSSIGGAVKYVSKKPADYVEGMASVELGDQGVFNVLASLNAPITDSFFMRVSGYADRNNGFLQNNITGVNNDHSREYAVRGAFRFMPSADTDINLSLRYSDLDNGGNDYYVTDSTEGYRLSSDLDRNIFNRRQVFGAILNVEQTIGDLTLTSLTSFTERTNEIMWDLDYGPADGVWVFQSKPVKTKVFTQELRLQSDNFEGFNWLAGAYYSRVRDRSLVTLADVVIGADFNDGTSLFINDFHNNTSLEQTYAGFATFNYTAGPFEASLGARLNHTDFFGFNRLINEGLHVRDTVILPKLSLSYDVASSAMVYFNLSQGYEPGRFSLFNETPLLPYLPEKAWNFELGIKGQSDSGLLTYELASFYIISQDRQLETLVVVDNVPNEAIGNVGDASTFGLEASLSLRPTDELTFGLNSGWMRSEFTAGDFDGFDVPYAPEFSGGISADYSADISESLDLSIRVDASHNSGFFWDTVNAFSQESYQLVNARIAIGTIDDTWELALRAQNLFDERYHSELQPFDGDLLARLGQPRMIVGTATLRF